MPIYTYKCLGCGYREEALLPLSERDNPDFCCDKCGDQMRRIMDVPNIGKPAYQMQAITDNGRHIPGHFGKSARKK